jgi:D-sedoheptulose 7-phosphate isomerase
MKRASRTSRGPLERMARAALLDSGMSMRRLERACSAAVAAAAEVMITCLQNGGSLFFCGNGGSAADAQHLACELAGRYLMDRTSLPATALTTNTSSLTAIGNDYGYDQVFSRQLEGLGKPGDVLVAITTSGGSRSVMRAVAAAHRLGMTVVGMTGMRGSAFAAKCDIALITPHTVTPRIQEGHIAMGHTFCELIERAMFEAPGQPVSAGVAARRKVAVSGRSGTATRATRPRGRGRRSGPRARARRASKGGR